MIVIEEGKAKICGRCKRVAVIGHKVGEEFFALVERLSKKDLLHLCAKHAEQEIKLVLCLKCTERSTL